MSIVRYINAGYTEAVEFAKENVVSASLIKYAGLELTYR
jgi:hypothetical protein